MQDKYIYIRTGESVTRVRITDFAEERRARLIGIVLISSVTFVLVSSIIAVIVRVPVVWEMLTQVPQ